MDDAAVVALSPEVAVCLTADFITPVVDNARDFGAIAAANALSDVFAMGGVPLAALNLVCWPSAVPLDVLSEVLSGGAAAAAEAGCMIVGGHTIDDREPKYGLAVIGTVRPERIVRNVGAKPGDLLYLTKPLGTGVVATAIKAEFAEPAEAAAATASMKRLNRAAAEAALAAGVRAMTDVTGFGLVGHLLEMLGQNLGAEVRLEAIPRLPGVERLIGLGMVPAGAFRNRQAHRERISFPAAAPSDEMLLFDPQTSGGLLLAIPPEQEALWLAETQRRGFESWKIGQFRSSPGIDIR